MLSSVAAFRARRAVEGCSTPTSLTRIERDEGAADLANRPISLMFRPNRPCSYNLQLDAASDYFPARIITARVNVANCAKHCRELVERYSSAMRENLLTDGACQEQ